MLFLCVANAARSQMAEALARSLYGDRVSVQSAGSMATAVHEGAVAAMAERGIDISDARSKSLTEFLDQRFDYVITVCDDANETCPIFPGAPNRIHWSFPDPSSATGTHDHRLSVFRQVRDGLEARLEEWLAELEVGEVQV